jgi:hypothetical protein
MAPLPRVCVPLLLPTLRKMSVHPEPSSRRERPKAEGNKKAPGAGALLVGEETQGTQKAIEGEHKALDASTIHTHSNPHSIACTLFLLHRPHA